MSAPPRPLVVPQEPAVAPPPADAVVSAMPAPLCVLDARGRVVRVNDAWDRLLQDFGLGEGRRRCVGDLYADVCRRLAGVLPDAPTLVPQIADLLQTRRGPLVRTLLVVRPDDTRRLQLQAQALPDGGAVVLHVDLGPASTATPTDQPKDDEAVWLLDAASRTTFVSRRAAALLGEVPGVLLARAAYLHLDHASVATFHAGLQRWRQGVADRLELRLRRADGTPLWVSAAVQPLHHDDGTYAGLRMVLEDISERYEAEERLQAALDSLQAVIAASPLAITATDLDGRVERWNAAAARLFGWTESEALGACLPPVPEEAQPLADALRAEALAGGVVTGRETFRLARDGAPVHVSVSVSPLHHRDGRPRGLVYVFDDIGPRKQAEVEVIRAQRIAATAKLAGGVAHDVNNLMAGVLGNAELLRTDLAGQPDVVPVLDDIAQAAVRAGELAQQLLAYARGGRYRPEQLDLAPVIAGVLVEQQRDLGPRAKIRQQFAEDLWTVDADRGQMAQLAAHLIANAIEATQEKGAVVVRLENVTLDEAWAERRPGARSGPHVRLSVADSGAGMTPYVQEHAFEPFFTTRRGARGLGLAAAFGIAKSHGGYVHLESRLGEGTMIEVYLPARPAQARPAEVPTGDPLPRGTETLLVVDDERSVRDVMKRLLERLGYTVDLAEGGAEALDLFAATPDRYDLVVLDLRMPQMRGAELFRHLRALRPGLRILVATGFERDEEAQALLDEGAAGFLQKPFEQTRLAQAIRRALAAAR